MNERPTLRTGDVIGRAEAKDEVLDTLSSLIDDQIRDFGG